MNTYSLFTVIHASLASLAMLAGIIAIGAVPKGSKLHKAAGRYYLYIYGAAILTGLAMLALKFNAFTLAFTVLNIYFLYMGYSFSKGNQRSNRVLNWVFLSVLFLVFIQMVLSFILILGNLFTPDYGWPVVRLFYVVFT
ncbi:MAG TPA: hypothetical protein VFU15_09285, partial [Bacteroidia bacterium]|nr:hypothetical protein [Bacteroidia bacterium]